MSEFVLIHTRRFCSLLPSGNEGSNPQEDGRGNEGWGTPKNMSHVCDWLTFDIMGDLCFGEDAFNTLSSPEYRHVPHLIADSGRRGNTVCLQYNRFLRIQKLSQYWVIFP